MLTTKEKEMALKDLDMIMHQNFDTAFGDYAQAIFMCTDKMSVLLDIMGNVKKCMIPASSGEGAIEFAAKGIDVYTYDINNLSYYAEQLRIAATMALEYKEFLSFFFRFEEKEILAEKYYIKLRDDLSLRAKFLLDRLFSSTSGEEILIKLFDIVRLCPSFLNRPEHYMKMAHSLFAVNREEGFYEAKKVDLQGKIHFAQFDILDIDSSKYKNERDFEMIFFSNILYSLQYEDKLKFIRMLNNEYLKYLKEGGSLINYFHSITGLPRHLGSEEEYQLYDSLRTMELQLLGNISDDFYEIGEGMNGMGLYRDDVVHLIKKTG